MWEKVETVVTYIKVCIVFVEERKQLQFSPNFVVHSGQVIVENLIIWIAANMMSDEEEFAILREVGCPENDFLR